MTSTPDLSQLDPDEQLRRNALAMRASVIPQQPTSAAGPVIAPPSVAQGVNLPGVGPAADANTSPGDSARVRGLSQDEAQLSQLKNAPRFMGAQSGIASLKPQSTLGKVGKGILGGLDVIGSTLAPGLTARIPGTSMHHALLENQAAGNVASDVAQAQKGAETEEAKARSHQAEASAQATENAQPAMDEQAFAELIKQGIDPLKAYQQVKQAGQKPTEPNEFATWLQQNPGKSVADFEAMKAQAKPHQGNDFEQFYQQYLHDNNLPDSARNRLMARQQYEAAGQKPQQEPHQFVFVPDGKGGMTAQVIRPGMSVPQGTVTPSQAAKGPSADEIRRADLAENMNENLNALEDIVNRRPELFGPAAGRITSLKEMVGTGDPDVAKLKTIKEYLGMASVGAHAMRNAQHVGEAANAVMNGFVNSPAAIKASIATARQSLQTFRQDIEHPKTGVQGSAAGGAKDYGPAPAGKAEGSTGTTDDGTKVVIRNGRIVGQ